MDQDFENMYYNLIEDATSCLNQGNIEDAISYYESLLDICDNENDLYLTKEIIFLLRKKNHSTLITSLEMVERLMEYDFKATLSSYKKNIFNKNICLQRLDSKKINKLVKKYHIPFNASIGYQFLNDGFIGINFDSGKMFILDTNENIVIPCIDLNSLFLINKNNYLYSYYPCGVIEKLSDVQCSEMILNHIDTFNILFIYHHSTLEYKNIVDCDVIHRIFNRIKNQIDIKFNMIDHIKNQNIQIFDGDEAVFYRYLRYINPKMWYSRMKDTKLHYSSLQYTIAGDFIDENKETVFEILSILKLLPIFDVGKKIVFNKNSYYLPYVEEYYVLNRIERNIDDFECENFSFDSLCKKHISEE